MFKSWLQPNKTKLDLSNSKGVLHEILGTPITAPINADEQEILFACGCFWGAEKGFWKLPGVVTTAVGYAGGHATNPTYNQVCGGRTGHTEVVRVVWRQSLIDISDLLKMFWECHDPTQGNRQGNDSGTQYRSAIYISNPDHKRLIDSSLKTYQKNLNSRGFGTITTEVKSNQKFFYAEDYHQQYLAKPGSRPYCSAMPTNVLLEDFEGANFILKKEVWSHFDWNISHCVLRSNNSPITQ
ncbi:peptide-methionine (S)-S-oxide reductase MsrA [Prochlorococcus sp. MIT 1307]|uniref:peptide-methionine (S)-S-oxide reductase MsrA n=1 Tax=Prochlorococcus sp. MIT 1307 TaxID=3096219 RepID=UPI002A75CF16|nr:peptide-methionine (S)-S-oxide reductase MsrA [Prochlorococcus sp. MIT 1307]